MGTVLLAAAIAFSTQSQDVVVHLRNGTSLVGTLEGFQDGHYLVDAGGAILRIPEADVLEVAPAQPADAASSPDDLQREVERRLSEGDFEGAAQLVAQARARHDQMSAEVAQIERQTYTQSLQGVLDARPPEAIARILGAALATFPAAEKALALDLVFSRIERDLQTDPEAPATQRLLDALTPTILEARPGAEPAERLRALWWDLVERRLARHAFAAADETLTALGQRFPEDRAQAVRRAGDAKMEYAGLLAREGQLEHASRVLGQALAIAPDRVDVADLRARIDHDRVQAEIASRDRAGAVAVVAAYLGANPPEEMRLAALESLWARVQADLSELPPREAEDAIVAFLNLAPGGAWAARITQAIERVRSLRGSQGVVVGTGPDLPPTIGTSTEPGAGDYLAIERYFPHAPGTRWVYRSKAFDEIVAEIRDVRVAADGRHVVRELTTRRGAATARSTEEYVVTPTEVRFVGESGSEVVLWVPGPRPDPEPRRSALVVSTRRIAHTNATVTVPAGAFPGCWVVELETRAAADEGTGVSLASRKTYAPGVGEIKFEFTGSELPDDLGYELCEFTRPAAP